MELRYIEGNTYYFDNPSVIGLYRLSEEACLLIDTGLDKDVARKALRMIEENGWKVTHVLNTHAHADHCGGNQYLKKNTGAHFMASKTEKSYIESPSIEPHYLYGAFAPKQLRGKFLQAKPSDIDEIVGEGEIVIGNHRFMIVGLPGHSPDQIGMITPDKVFFLGDTVIDAAIVEKHSWLYNYNLEDLFASIARVEHTEADTFVLSHGGPRKDISGDLKINLEKLNELNQKILDMATEPIGKHALHKFLAKAYGMEESIPGYFLNDSLLASHLNYLIEKKSLLFELIDGEIVYTRA
jgi:glyoxylase-like metal-dependent hydrolase (beta-lactamase superfamily II)